MTWKTCEELAMHVAAVAAICFALLIATGYVHAEPRCHQHHGVTHCH